MGLVLRPGMRLMRRLGVTSKFGLITVLLLVPMCLSLVSSYRAATTEISLTEREQHGLRYVRPLVGLVIDLAQTRNLAEAGHRPPSQAWMGLVGELDDVSALYGEDLGVHSAWLRVRSQVREVYADGTDPAQLPILAERAARATQDLV